MATIRKRGNKWRAEIRMKGIRRSKSFKSKAAAEAWARKIEVDIEDETIGKIPKKVFGDLLRRYVDDVLIKQRGAPKREITFIDSVLKDPLAQVPLREISSKDIAAWRDRRLESVSGSTVCREWNVLSRACTIAIKEWHWLHFSPTAGAQRPKENPPRKRRPKKEEIDAILKELGYEYEQPPYTVSGRVGAIYLFALETGMRSGEICDLTKEHVYPRHVHIPKSKNEESRDVPLSREAKRILEQVMEVTDGADTVFNVDHRSRDTLFRDARGDAGVVGTVFHDSRRDACTRLSKIYGPLELAKISGHKKLDILLNTYYSPNIDKLADKMDESDWNDN